MNNLTVIALGGSIMVPDKIDWQFLKKFKSFIYDQIEADKHFIIVAGGGRTARNYQEAAEHVIDVPDEDKDWLGIHATRLNAHLLRTIFRDKADPVVFDSRFKLKSLTYPITIASGWHPGWSTDYIAIALAIDFQAQKTIIAGKPDYVYEKDNQKFPDAKPLENLTWAKYQRLIPDKWSPGLHAPVDPIASQLAEESQLTVCLIKGDNLKNFDDLLSDQPFKGTTIS